jgi:hypothetical protein
LRLSDIVSLDCSIDRSERDDDGFVPGKKPCESRISTRVLLDQSQRYRNMFSELCRAALTGQVPLMIHECRWTYYAVVSRAPETMPEQRYIPASAIPRNHLAAYRPCRFSTKPISVITRPRCSLSVHLMQQERQDQYPKRTEG